MFSFFKKLLGFQKTDQYTDKEEQQVKLENISDHADLVNLKIKDISLNKSCKNSESYQQVELNKFNNFYSKESTFSSSSDKSLTEHYKNNVIHQKGDLNKFSNFHAKENTSSASASNVDGNFDIKVNIIPKSQRKCKKLATKKIKEVIKDLSVDSIEIDDMEDECREPKSRKKPKLIKQSNRLHQKTLRFCLKCKTSQTMVGNATLRKSCNKCSSILYYLCTICKDKNYASYRGWKVHEKRCDCKSISQKMESMRSRRTSNRCLNSVVNDKTVRSRLMKTKDNAAQAKKPVLGNTEDGVNIEEGKGKALIKKVLVVKPMKTKRFQKWIRRYCPKCQKSVAVKTLFMKKKIKCQTCTTQLQFQCVKCHATKESDYGIYHHLRHQCLPNDNTSISSKIRPTKSRLMSSIQLMQNKYLKCDMCTYQSEFKANLKRHVIKVHMQK